LAGSDATPGNTRTGGAPKLCPGLRHGRRSGPHSPRAARRPSVAAL